MNKIKQIKNLHLVKNPETELKEKDILIKYIDKKLSYTWDQLIEIGCEIDNPLSINFVIKNRKASDLENRLNKVKEYLSWNKSVSDEVKQKLLQIIGD